MLIVIIIKKCSILYLIEFCWRHLIQRSSACFFLLIHPFSSFFSNSVQTLSNNARLFFSPSLKWPLNRELPQPGFYSLTNLPNIIFVTPNFLDHHDKNHLSTSLSGYICSDFPKTSFSWIYFSSVSNINHKLYIN